MARDPHPRLGFEPSQKVATDGFLDLIGVRIYMDCSRMPEMFTADYPFAYDIDLLRTNPDAAQQPPTLPTGGLREQACAAKLAGEVTANIREQAKDLDQRFDRDFTPKVTAWCEDQDRIALVSLSDTELAGLWEKVMRCGLR